MSEGRLVHRGGVGAGSSESVTQNGSLGNVATSDKTPAILKENGSASDENSQSLAKVENKNGKHETSKSPEQNGLKEIRDASSLLNGRMNGEESNVIANTTGVATRRPDEYEVDFSDTREFAVWRWNDILGTAARRLSPADQKICAKFSEWSDLMEEIQSKLTDPASTPVMKRLMTKIHPLPRFLSTLARLFTKTISPREVSFDLLWGVIYINLKLSYGSLERLTRTCNWLFMVRRVVELFNRCIETCEEMNEARIAIVDFFDPLMLLAMDSIGFLQDNATDAAATKAWPEFDTNVATQVSVLEATVRHLNEITSYSKVNQDRRVKNMSLRHALIPEAEETAAFPVKILPFRQNPRFYGRQEELDKIIKYLSPKDDQSLRTYTIYGRRGVGKTEIALQFANSNTASFDAIFWIQCETSVAIRQSFTDVAVSLNLPKADRDGHHEENLLAVHHWLKKTRKRWLLIFDNAERDQILQGYWPIGASGAILITSRKYHNFSRDMKRQGDTVKPFDAKQSWELLLELLGEDWKSLDRQGLITPSEVNAAKGLLSKLEGLALAIQQAASLIKNSKIGGPTIATTYEMFKEKMRTLPERHRSERSSSEQALDALWDMIFTGLSRNSRTLLGVLSWLSPDAIFAELFLPRDQQALDGSMAFCKTLSRQLIEGSTNPYSNMTSLAPALEKALDELEEKQLIRRDGRVISIHRVVQEATNYHDVEDLQASFNYATRLVYEAFPGQTRAGDSLYALWNKCQLYIPHGVFLSKKFSDYTQSGALSGSDIFVRLLSNCAWYLYEISDYQVCFRVIETAASACQDKNSLIYADLRNTAGSCYYELNRLGDCRKAWEETYRIRQRHLAHDNKLIGAVIHNLGNLETATGNLAESMECFEKAQLISTSTNSSSASLATIYLGIARVYYLQYDFEKARRTVAQAELLIVRQIGADKGFMVHVHYLYGNIELIQKHWEPALRAYDNCLKIALAETPIHPITAAAYYSLACVELEMNHPEPARAFLEKARTIAELRSPSRDDGVIARILWKMAMVLESDTFGRYGDEAAELRRRAEIARSALLASGEGGFIPFIEHDNLERTQEEDDYDSLVPLYFR